MRKDSHIPPFFATHLSPQGTAIVLFTVFLRLSEGEKMNAGEVIEAFCRLALGGVALGKGG